MSAPITLRATPARPQLHMCDAPQLVYLLINAQIAAPLQQRTPLNLCLVLDRSLSMRGERLFHLKEAARQLLSELDAQDVLSVVTFNDRAEVVVPAQYVRDPDELYGAIANITASGGTEMAQGLSVGLTELDRIKTASVRRLILLTDGRTYGDELVCTKLTQHAQQAGIGLTALGIGTEWNEDLLQAMAAHEDSRALYVTSPRELAGVFNAEVERLHHLISQRVDLTIQTHPQTELRALHRVQPFVAALSPLGSTSRRQANLGAWAANEEQQLLLELLIPPTNGGNVPIARLQIGCLVCGTSTPLAAASEIALPAVAQVDAPINSEVQHALERVIAYRLQARAWEAVAQGQLDDAVKRLRVAGTHLFNAGETALAHALHDEANHLVRGGAADDDRRKRIKLGTRGLLAEADQVQVAR